MKFIYNAPPITLQRLLISLFCITVLCSPRLWAAPYCRDSGLVDIPTGKVIEHGIFNLGTYFGFRNEGELPRDEVALQLDFGLFDRVEIGLTSVRHNRQSFLLGNLKVLLLREDGAVPNIAVGLENIGDSIESGLNDSGRYERKSAFLAVSKQFALPRIHHITGHIGIGNRRFVEEIGMSQVLHGVFFGISKDFHPAFARGSLTLSVEVDGRGVNTGIRHIADSGLQVYVAAEALNAPATDGKKIRYLAGVSWTNRALMKRVKEVRELAKQAARLASQSKKTTKESNK